MLTPQVLISNSVSIVHMSGTKIRSLNISCIFSLMIKGIVMPLVFKTNKDIEHSF